MRRFTLAGLKMRRLTVAAILLVMSVCGPARAAEPVDVELVLLADASGSIDAGENRFQRQGYAEAIRHRDVLNAIARGAHRKIAVTFIEWGDDRSQDIVVPWMVIGGPASAQAFGHALLAAPRKAYGRNAIGAAIAIAQAQIEGNAYAGDKKVIDLSADSANSWTGVSIAEARAKALSAGIVINGLAILCREADCSGRPTYYDLEQAFAKTIIGGPGSFVVTADSKDSFAEAVRRKLVLELADAGQALRRTISFERNASD
jgi:hypothetical protein